MEAKLTAQAEQRARELASQAGTIDELNGLFRGLMKSALQRMLDTEMDVHLGRKEVPALLDPPSHSPPADASKNRRNGHSQKTVQGELGEVRIDIPRDRLGTFEPQLIGKYQRRLAGFDDKVLALYAKGLTTRDIQDVVQERYGIEVSATLISEITADLDGEVSLWRSRRLEAVWPIVYFDGIVVHVRSESGCVSPHTLHVALGVNFQGRKELLGLWLGQNEGAKFWLGCLTDLSSRGRADIFVACVDGLTGFPEAIRAAYPQTKVQRCGPPGAGGFEVCQRQGQQGGGEGPQGGLPGGDGRRGGTGSGSLRPDVGWQIADDQQAVAAAVGGHRGDVRVPAPDPPSDLHDERDRERQQRDKEIHPQPQAIPQRGERGEAELPGDRGGVEEVDDADRGLEAGVEPLRPPVREPVALEPLQVIWPTPPSPPDTTFPTGPI